MLASEKLKQLIEVANKNFDNYKPSPHILYFYYDMGISDLESACINFREAMRCHLEDLSKLKIEIEDFNETDPGPLFFIDTSDPVLCFAVLEHKVVSSIASSIYKNMLNLEHPENDITG